MNDQPQWIQDALDADPLVQHMREAYRHPTVWRNPPVEGMVSDITVHMECPDCWPAVENFMILEEVMRAEGVLCCLNCRRDIPIPSEDLPNLVALKKAKDSGDFREFIHCISVIQDNSMPPFSFLETNTTVRAAIQRLGGTNVSG